MIHNPVRDAERSIACCELEDVERARFVMETVRLTRAGLPARFR